MKNRGGYADDKLLGVLASLYHIGIYKYDLSTLKPL